MKKLKMFTGIGVCVAIALTLLNFCGALASHGSTSSRSYHRAAGAATVEGRDSSVFDQILTYWRASFPKSTFEGAEIHLLDGPRKQRRLHIAVPEDIEHLYGHGFSQTFLEGRVNSENVLERAIARDLLRIKRGVMHRTKGLTVSYDGSDKKRIKCVDYVVPYDK